MKLIIDAMGGDYAPIEIVKGSIEKLNITPNLSLIFTGQEAIIKQELSKYTYPLDRVEIVNATEIIEMNEPPVAAIKNKKNSSLVVALDLLKEGRGDAFITAGSTGATLAGALLRVGRIKGIKRPALAPIMPSKTKGVLLIDCGANMDCKPVNLAQFAIMGSIYMEKVLGIPSPRVGLASVGVEDEKGNELSRASFELIKEENAVNFIGNIEGRDVFDKVDVVVADGFAGNIMLKSIEGMAVFMFDILKTELTSSLRSKIGALLLKPSLRRMKKTLDYTSYGGAPLLGIDGIIIKAHGSTKARTVHFTIQQAMDMVNADLVNVIKSSIVSTEEND